MDFDARNLWLERAMRQLARDQALVERSLQHMREIQERLKKTQQVMNDAASQLNSLSPIVMEGRDSNTKGHRS